MTTDILKIIEEEQVEVCPEKLLNAVLDENVVCIHLIRKYFSHDAWLSVNSVVQHEEYICMQILFP